MSMSDQGYPGWQSQFDATNLPAALKFMVSQMMAANSHVALVLVKAVTASQTAGAPPTVDVQPMVAQVDQKGNATPHGIIHGIPVFRLQSGATAIVIDPTVGDIGVVVCADRDITSAITNQSPANPGSFRRFDWADAMYFGGVASTAPTDCAVIVSPSGVEISGTNGNLIADGNLGTADASSTSYTTPGGQIAAVLNGILIEVD